MPSQIKYPKTKPLKKATKFSPSQLKSQSFYQKHTSFDTIFKNLEIETTCELPTIDEEKPELEA
jgi:hypothetical protein